MKNKIIKIMIPIAIQSLIAFVATQIDSLMLGRLDPNGLTACNYANQVFFIMSGVVSGVAAGANILSSQYYGRGETDKINTVLTGDEARLYANINISSREQLDRICEKLLQVKDVIEVNRN